MGYLRAHGLSLEPITYKGGEYCFSLVMHGFCSNKALYLASFSFTMFIGPAAAAGQVIQNKGCPSFPFSSVFWNWIISFF